MRAFLLALALQPSASKVSVRFHEPVVLSGRFANPEHAAVSLPTPLWRTPRQNRRLMSDDFRRFEKCSKACRLQLAPAEPCAAAKLRCAGARVM